VSAPSLGAASYQKPGTWTTAFSYRYQHSDRHFVGSEEQKQRQEEGSQVINDINLMELSLGYAITKRFTASLSIPFQVATRSQVVRSNDAARTILDRYHTSADGIGDVRGLATCWLMDPDQSKKWNVSLGAGFKAPTGEKDARDTFQVFRNGQIVAEERTVDQSIQPGDGGWGVIADIYAFREVVTNFNLFIAGTYIATPQEENGVPTYRSNPYEQVMSIADQYLARGGFGYTFLPKLGLTFTLAGRIEGVPVRDLIGGSDGFRRPGFAVAIEPGLVLVKNSWTAALSAPVALHRNRQRSVADMKTGPNVHGDAAFADYVILFSLGKAF